MSVASGVVPCEDCGKDIKFGFNRSKYKKCPTCFSKKSREISLKEKYNLSVQEYEDMLVHQFGVCAICKRQETHTYKSRGKTLRKRLAVDHCHTTGKVRGLLCHACNSALGLFKDNIKSLASAIEYLSVE